MFLLVMVLVDHYFVKKIKDKACIILNYASFYCVQYCRVLCQSSVSASVELMHKSPEAARCVS